MTVSSQVLKSKEISDSLKTEQLHPIFLQYHLDTLKTKIGEITNIDSNSFPPYKVIQFYFKERNPKEPWPYGSGIIIVDESNSDNEVIWYNLIYGDFGAHTLSWIDFDNDGDKDLYHLVGFEDVFKSRLFLNQINTRDRVPFKMIYNNNIAYCVLVDFNKDGFPEILNQVKKIDLEDYDWNPAFKFKLEEDEKQKIAKEYDRIVGNFDQFNFDYNMPNHYKEFSISISSDVNILSVINDTVVDVSGNYPDHFCFRGNIIMNISEVGSEIKPLLNELENKYKDKFDCN
jgi:hypothetical protein